MTPTAPRLDTCRKRCAWHARKRGDMLTELEAKSLELSAFLCALDVALRDGLELVSDLD